MSTDSNSELSDHNSLLTNDATSDEYNPDHETSTDDEEERQKVKNRKVLNPSKWKKNIRKRRLALGKKHINSAKKLVLDRKTGPNCKCKFKCFDNFSNEEKDALLKKFNSIGNKVNQDTYLIGLINSRPTQERQQPHDNIRVKRRMFTNKYSIKLANNVFKVCRKAFAALHGISIKRVEILAEKTSKGCISPKELRGKHQNRPKAIPEDTVKQIHNHILSFPRRESHYSRSSNLKHYYLSPDLTIRKMHRLFLEKYGQGKTAVSFDFYYRYFRSNFHMSFGHPRSDTCQECDQIQLKLKMTTLSEEERKSTEQRKSVHLAKAQAFYNDLSTKSKLAEENDNIDTLCFDYQKNMPLPSVTATDVFYKRQLWVYNLCIYSAKNKAAQFYMYTESTGKKSPNEVISFLNHYLENVVSKSVKKLYIFTDNCAAQNKNRSLVFYFFHLVNQKRFEIISQHFPEPGHSFLPCDRCFGLIEKKKRRKEKIYVPSEYESLVKESSTKFKVTSVTRNMILDYSSYLNSIYKKLTLNETRDRFLISKYKRFVYDAAIPDRIACSQYHNLDSTYVFFYPTKTCIDVASVNLKQLYNEQIPLQEAKYKDVMALANKYVPQCDIWFYAELTAAVCTSRRNTSKLNGKNIYINQTDEPSTSRSGLLNINEEEENLTELTSEEE